MKKKNYAGKITQIMDKASLIFIKYPNKGKPTSPFGSNFHLKWTIFNQTCQECSKPKIKLSLFDIV